MTAEFILNFLLVLLFCLGPIWVYFDAVKYKIGQVPNTERGFLKNWSAMNWALFIYPFGPISLVFYILKRRVLIKQAAASPITEAPKRKTLNITILAFISFFYSMMTFPDFLQEYENTRETARLKILAENGDADAQYEYGRRIFYDRSNNENREEALKWYRKSAEQGDADGQFCMALYERGNVSQAIKWLLKSAAQDNQYAEYRLGKIFDSGDDSTKNEVSAYFWYRLAERHPYFSKDIDNMSNGIAKRMTQEEINVAQKMLREWNPVNVVKIKMADVN